MPRVGCDVNGGLSVTVPQQSRFSLQIQCTVLAEARYLGCVQRVRRNSTLSAQVSCQSKTTIKVIFSRSRGIHVVEAPIPNQTRGKLERALGRDK